MTETFDIVLDRMPPSLNKRLHWRVRYAMSNPARLSTKLQALSARHRCALPKADGPRSVVIEVRRGSKLQDVDNCISSLKPVLDGLVDAGWLVNDSPECLTDYRVRQERYAELGRSVVLRVFVEDES